MLDNLVGSKGVAPEELISDIRTLCSLGADDLSEMAKVFTEFGESIISEQAEALKSIEKNVKAFQKDRKLLESTLPASGFILRRWAQNNLTREQIVDDLVGIGISEEQRTNLASLLDAMAENVESIRQKLLEDHALGLGIPRVKTVTCACDTRAVFLTNKYEETEDDKQSYFVLSRLVPVAILEIVARLNQEETNHSFLLDEEELEDMCNILQRAHKRIERVKAALKKSSYLEG